MNHDVTHCLDYKKGKCPGRCYLAVVTADLKQRPELNYLPLSWAHFENSPECPINSTGYEEVKSQSGLISRADLFNQLATLPCSDNEFKAKLYEIIQALPEL